MGQTFHNLINKNNKTNNYLVKTIQKFKTNKNHFQQTFDLHGDGVLRKDNADNDLSLFVRVTALPRLEEFEADLSLFQEIFFLFRLADPLRLEEFEPDLSLFQEIFFPFRLADPFAVYFAFRLFIIGENRELKLAKRA